MPRSTGDETATEKRRLMVFALLSAAAALTASVSIPGEEPGLNLAATGALVLGAVWVATHRAMNRPDEALAVLASTLLIFFVVRSAEWVLALDIVILVALASIATTGAQKWAEVSLSAPRAVKNLPRGIVFALAPLTPRAARGGTLNAAPFLRTLTITAILLAGFGTLFLSADPAFASLAERFLVPGFDASLIPLRLAAGVGTLALAGSLALLSPELSFWDNSDFGSAIGDSHPELGGVEWKTILIVIDVLFAAFVAVQVAVLFGGHDHVLRTAGLTYAEYARQGFFQLVAVALLTLAVVAATVWFARAEGSDRTWLKVLLGILCLLTLVILVSASKRMALYQEAYGFTRLRLLVDLTIILIGGIFVLLLAAGITWKGGWLPRAVVVLVSVTLIGFNLYNPDARIAERNIDRFFRTGDIDLVYLAHLSADAAPQLMRLPEPQRSCALGRLTLDLDGTSFWSWNIGRERARKLVGAFAPATGAVDGTACP